MRHTYILICLLLFTLSRLKATEGKNSTNNLLKLNVKEDSNNAKFKSDKRKELQRSVKKYCNGQCYNTLGLCSLFRFGLELEKCFQAFPREIYENATFGNQNYYDTSLIRNYRSNKYLLLNLKEIEEILTAVHEIRNLAIYYIDYGKGDGSDRCYSACGLEYVKQSLDKLNDVYSSTWCVYIFQKYVEITLAAVVVILGLVMDGTLLFIFIKHREIISETNMIILSLAVCDFVGLVIVYPIHYILVNGLYYSRVLRLIYGFTIILLSVSSALSIFTLSIQRLLVVLEIPLSENGNKRSRVFTFILFVWGLPICVAGFIYTFDSNVLGFTSIYEYILFPAVVIFFFLVVLPITITVINVIISRKLKKSAEQIPGEIIQQDRIDARNRSSRVVTFFCVIFWFTRAPVLCGSLIILFKSTDSDVGDLVVKYFSFVINTVFCLNAFLNPLTIVIMCKNFRELYGKYILRRKN